VVAFPVLSRKSNLQAKQFHKDPILQACPYGLPGASSMLFYQQEKAITVIITHRQRIVIDRN
jgi:hypothetical protein